MSDCGQAFGQIPVVHIMLQISVSISITFSPPACTYSPGILSLPGDFPFFKDLTAFSISLFRIGNDNSS